MARTKSVSLDFEQTENSKFRAQSDNYIDEMLRYIIENNIPILVTLHREETPARILSFDYRYRNFVLEVHGQSKRILVVQQRKLMWYVAGKFHAEVKQYMDSWVRKNVRKSDEEYASNKK